MMQFNMYHHYTVDEHLLRTVGELHAIESGKLAETLPVSSRIVGEITERRALYVAAFLHDIAKGRLEDHSVQGAKIAHALGPRLGLTEAETETVAWLIREHLTMSMTAQNRDIGDPRTITDFARVVGTVERLQLLLLLTVADIRAVGPGVWNGWKGQLLRTLYRETERVLADGSNDQGAAQRTASARAELQIGLADWPAADIDRFIARQYPDYFIRVDSRRQAEHARLLKSAENQGRQLATSFMSDRFNAITELSVAAANHPRLLALFAGACAASGANIVGAHISTTRDGVALDTFLLQRELAEDEDEARRARRIGETIERLLRGDATLASLMNNRRHPERRVAAFHVTPEVSIDNQLSDRLTVIEVAGLDRPGLLFELTSALSDLSLDIVSAHIATYGEKVIDVFYVTDLTAKKIVSEQRQAAIRQRVTAILAG
jgi:[protein-PII] uridylyltransferase